jgi:hypothetical protein
MRLAGKVDGPLHRSAQSFNRLTGSGTVERQKAELYRHNLNRPGMQLFCDLVLDVRDDETKWQVVNLLVRGARPQSPSL